MSDLLKKEYYKDAAGNNTQYAKLTYGKKLNNEYDFSLPIDNELDTVNEFFAQAADLAVQIILLEDGHNIKLLPHKNPATLDDPANLQRWHIIRRPGEEVIYVNADLIAYVIQHFALYDYAVKRKLGLYPNPSRGGWRGKSSDEITVRWNWTFSMISPKSKTNGNAKVGRLKRSVRDFVLSNIIALLQPEALAFIGSKLVSSDTFLLPPNSQLSAKTFPIDNPIKVHDTGYLTCRSPFFRSCYSNEFSIYIAKLILLYTDPTVNDIGEFKLYANCRSHRVKPRCVKPTGFNAMYAPPTQEAEPDKEVQKNSCTLAEGGIAAFWKDIVKANGNPIAVCDAKMKEIEQELSVKETALKELQLRVDSLRANAAQIAAIREECAAILTKCQAIFKQCDL